MRYCEYNIICITCRHSGKYWIAAKPSEISSNNIDTDDLSLEHELKLKLLASFIKLTKHAFSNNIELKVTDSVWSLRVTHYESQPRFQTCCFASNRVPPFTRSGM
jgi:hypothetical protein